jgi:hypothetical protein
MKSFTFRYNFRRRLARFLARIELHRFETLDSPMGEMVRKSRRRMGPAITFANLYLKVQGAGVEILPTRKWLLWESAVWAAMNNDVKCPEEKTSDRIIPCIRSKGLVIPRLPGAPLGRIVAHKSIPFDVKLQCFGWALQSLLDLHGLTADWGDGLVQLISHGDATAENVIIDQSQGMATWIDFDTRHWKHLPAIERHADDLRALTFSTASCLARSEYSMLSARIRNSYRNHDVIQCFKSRLLVDWHWPNPFHLAQAPLSHFDVQVLCQSLTSDLLGDEAADIATVGRSLRGVE